MPRQNLAFILVVFFAFACSQSSRPGPEIVAQQQSDRSKSTPIQRPSYATHYGLAHAPITLTDEEQIIWNRVKDASGNYHCKLEGSIVTAARKHATVLHNSSPTHAPLGIDYLRFALRAAGVPDYMISPIVFDLTEKGIRDLLQFTRNTQESFNHCGLGLTTSANSTKGVWVGINKIVKTTPFPTNPKPNTARAIHGTILGKNVIDVQAFLELPNGTVIKPQIFLVGKKRFAVTLPFTQKGRYIFELQANTGTGAETAILIPLFCDIPSEERPTIFPDFEDTNSSPKDTLTNLVNNTRRDLGLIPLKRDANLDRVAQAHCQDMVALNYFGHYSNTSGMLVDRLKANRLQPSESAENIARSSSIIRVHHNLMGSPSHKIKLLNPHYTHMGLGVVAERGYVVVTQIFARW